MGTSRTITERQLTDAKSALQTYAAKLTAEGVESTLFKRNTKWRQIDAKIRQLNSRLRAISAVEAVDAELKQRKAELASAE